MKIIAKTKDYYDYLQGVYGTDEKIVYDRRSGLGIGDVRNGDSYFIFINGFRYFTTFYDGRFRYGAENILKVLEEFLKVKSTRKDCWSSDLDFLFYYAQDKKLVRRAQRLEENWYPENFNRLLWKPVLISKSEDPNKCDLTEPLTLNQFNFGSVMTPHEVYVEISNFLSWCVDNPPIPDKQTDKEKVVSHGFDLRTSFRHRK